MHAPTVPRPLADRWWTGACVGALAALPTLVHMLWQPSFLVDDWGFAAAARSDGLTAFIGAPDMRSRPFQALYHGVTFVVLGPRPAWHLGLLAALNAVAALLVLRIARRWFDPRLSLLIAASWVVLANRGASRLWISTGPTMVALVFLLLAALFASLDRPRWILATAFVVASTLAYEGGVLIGLAVVLLAAWRTPSGGTAHRVLRAAGGSIVVCVVALCVLAFSPKSAAAIGPPATALPALFGTSLLPRELGGGRALVLVLLFSAGATAVVTELRRPAAARLFGLGATVAVLGMAPFLAVGFPLSTDGMLDRANTFATLGVAVLLAGALDQLWNLPGRVAAGAVAISLVLLASANVADLRNVHAAERDAEAAVASIAALDAHPETRLVVGPMPNRGGYASFGYDLLAEAVLLRTGRTLDVHDTLDEEQFDREAGRRYRFDPESESLVEVR